jgi:2'-5' RNA ligase
MRLFVAVNLSSAARDAIQRGIDEFPVPNPPWRWVSPDNWHLTLKFLGEIEPTRVSTLTHTLDEVGHAHRAFEMTLGAFGGFPSLRNPRVLFYDIERGSKGTLASDVDAALEHALGLSGNGGVFSPMSPSPA